MAASKTAEKDNGSKPLSFDVAACLLAVLNESGVTVGAKHYKLMNKIDGKSESSYDHMFRPIKAKARQISEMIKNGEYGDLDAAPVKKANGGAGGGKKRARKAKTEGQEDGADEGSAAKKVKQEPVADVEDADANAVSDTSG